MQEKMDIAKLTVEIQPDALRRVVEQGRLLEFAETYSALAARELKAQLLDTIAKAAVGIGKPGEVTQLNMVFIVDDGEFGTPHPHPFPWMTTGNPTMLQQVIRQIVREERERTG